MTAAPATDARPQAATALAVRLRGAALAYAGQSVFTDLDLDLAPGRFTCLLGPSGVGKSSLLRLIAGIAPEASADELAASDGRPLAGRIAYMDQRDLLLPWLDVLGNVTLGARLRGEAADLARARDLLARVGLAEATHKRPAELSGGMRQRAALVRTLLEDRPLVLMDEPFSALDALTRLRLQDLAADLLAGRTVLMVTHDPLEAFRLGHAVHVLAGMPARLSEAIVPAGAPPRDPGDPTLQALVGDLLHRLRAEEVPA